jgi:dTDP-glucose 4,6-dehydratase/UDP-glucose 4-epimerase
MHILIIGSQGFIGSNVTNYLRQVNGYHVYGCDVVSVNQSNYVQLDVASNGFAHLLQQVAFDVCINCSGAASVPASLQNPQHDFTLNTTNVFYMLDAIRQYRPQCKFINLSSAAVYGNPTQVPTPETAACAPISPYGHHKHMAEELCKMFHQQFGLATCSARIFSAYGPGLKKQLFWDLFQKSKANPNKIELFGTGQESRDFIHVQDIAQALTLIINKAAFTGSIYNVANGKSITIQHATTQLLTALGYTGEVLFGGEVRIGDPINWCSNIDAIKNLGYTTTKTFEAGINELAAWLKEQD